jgi:hypothetical protein
VRRSASSAVFLVVSPQEAKRPNLVSVGRRLLAGLHSATRMNVRPALLPPLFDLDRRRTYGGPEVTRVHACIIFIYLRLISCGLYTVQRAPCTSTSGLWLAALNSLRLFFWWIYIVRYSLHFKLQGIPRILESQSILSLTKIIEKITKNYNIK